jgi:hypothetical protein
LRSQCKKKKKKTDGTNERLVFVDEEEEEEEGKQKLGEKRSNKVRPITVDDTLRP